MKTIFRYSFLLAGLQAFAFLAVVCLSPLTGLGQDAAPDDPFVGKAVTTFDIDFPGGTLEEFADLVMSLNREVSITVAVEARRAKVPNMSFKKISFDELVSLVHSTTQNTQNQVRFQEASPGRWVGLAAIREEPRELAIFPVEQVLRKNSIDDFIAVVGKAFDVAGKGDAPQFHLHKETSVLMASLTKSEQAIVERLIGALEAPVPDGAAERAEKRKVVEVEIAEQRDRFQRLSMELAQMTAEAARLEEELGDADELARYSVRISMLDAERRLLENELASYMQLLSRLRAAELGVGDDLNIQPVAPAPPRRVQN